MTMHGVETLGHPDLIAAFQEPRLTHGLKLTGVRFKGKEVGRKGNMRVIFMWY